MPLTSFDSFVPTWTPALRKSAGFTRVLLLFQGVLLPLINPRGPWLSVCAEPGSASAQIATFRATCFSLFVSRQARRKLSSSDRKHIYQGTWNLIGLLKRLFGERLRFEAACQWASCKRNACACLQVNSAQQPVIVHNPGCQLQPRMIAGQTRYSLYQATSVKCHRHLLSYSVIQI